MFKSYLSKSGKITGANKKNQLYYLPMLLLQLILVTGIHAATKTSTATGNWSDASKWSPAGVPSASDDVIITGGHVITVDGAYTCQSLDLGTSVNANTTLQITTAGNTLTINGNLRINPNNRSRTYILNAGPGTVNVAGTFSSWGSSGTNSIRVGSGTLNFTPAINISSASKNITVTDAGTVNFYADFSDSYNRLVTYVNSNIYFHGNYTVNTTAADWRSRGTAHFGNGCTVTPTSNLTLMHVSTTGNVTLSAGSGDVLIEGNVTLNSSSIFSTTKNFELRGHWTNNGGTFSGGGNTILFSGPTRTIGGTSPTNFSNLQIGVTGGSSSVNYTLNQDITCQNMHITGGAGLRALNWGVSINASASGDVTIDQPTGNTTSSLILNSGNFSIVGNLTFTGTDATVSRISRVTVNTGSLTVGGQLSWMNNTSVATEVISVNTGSITFNNPVVMGGNSGTMNITGSGTINFNGISGTSFEFGGAAEVPVFTTVVNSTVTFKNGFTNNTNPYIFNPNSNVRFTGNGTYQPNASVTFGNVIIDAGTIAMNGDMTVKGSWTNLGGNLNGANHKVIFDGATSSINGIAPTDFPTLQVGASATAVAVNCTINNSNTCSTLIVTGSSTNISLAVASGATFDVSGDTYLEQPTADNRSSTFNVSSGNCSINGNLYFTGSNDVVSRTARVTVGSGNLELSGSVNWMNNFAVATEAISVSSGTLTFGSPLIMGENTGTLTISDIGTVYFNGTTGTSFEFGGSGVSPVLNTSAGSHLNFFNGFTNNSNQLTLHPSSYSTFTATGTFTPNAEVIFGHVHLSPAAIVTLAGDMNVKGNWYNYGGNLASNTGKVIFDGSSQTIDGDVSTDFSDIQIGTTLGITAVTYTMINNNTCANLLVEGYTTNRSLDLADGVVFDVTGDVTISQPTVNIRSSRLNVFGGTCNINGDLHFTGVNTTITRTGVVDVTSGTLNIAGNVTWMNNTSVATEVITVSTGVINFANSLTMGDGSGTLAVTGAGIVNFNGTTAPSLNFGGLALSPVLNTTDGSSLNFTNGLTNNTVTLTLATGSYANFVDNGTITPNAPITFGNLEVYGNKTVMLAGDVSATTAVTLQDGAILNEGLHILSGTAALNMEANSELRLQRNTTSTYPELTGNYNLTGGTVYIKQTANTANIRNANYFNLQLEGNSPSDISMVTNITNNLITEESGYFVNNGTLTIGGMINHSSDATSTLANDITTGGVMLNEGILNDGGRTLNINGVEGWVKNGGDFSTTGKVSFTGGVVQEIAGLSGTIFHKLQMDGTAGVTLNVNPATSTLVKDSLILLNGNITTNHDNILRINDNAYSTSGSVASYVDGPMTKVGNDDFQFPIGKGGKWRRAGISSIISAATEVTAEYFDAGYEYLTPVTGDLQQVSSTQYWNIERTGSSDGVRIRLFWNNPSGIGNCNNLKIAHYKSSQWVEEPATVLSGSYCNNTGSGSIETDNPVTTFSPFTFGDAGGALPVELLSFEAVLNNNVVTTQWSTAVEINNDYFIVEKSSDGHLFNEVVKVDGAGNSTETLHYQANDNNPYEGTSYYRLRQTDFDGTTTYSKIVAVNRENIIQINVFPNPVEGELNLNVVNASGAIELGIYDVAGHLVIGKNYSLNEMNTSKIFTLSVKDQVPPGIYFVKVNVNGNELNEKVIIR